MVIGKPKQHGLIFNGKNWRKIKFCTFKVHVAMSIHEVQQFTWSPFIFLHNQANFIPAS